MISSTGLATLTLCSAAPGRVPAYKTITNQPQDNPTLGRLVAKHVIGKLGACDSGAHGAEPLHERVRYTTPEAIEALGKTTTESSTTIPSKC